MLSAMSLFTNSLSNKCDFLLLTMCLSTSAFIMANFLSSILFCFQLFISVFRALFMFTLIFVFILMLFLVWTVPSKKHKSGNVGCYTRSFISLFKNNDFEILLNTYNSNTSLLCLYHEKIWLKIKFDILLHVCRLLVFRWLFRCAVISKYIEDLT